MGTSNPPPPMPPAHVAPAEAGGALLGVWPAAAAHIPPPQPVYVSPPSDAVPQTVPQAHPSVAAAAPPPAYTPAAAMPFTPHEAELQARLASAQVSSGRASPNQTTPGRVRAPQSGHGVAPSGEAGSTRDDQPQAA